MIRINNLIFPENIVKLTDGFEIFVSVSEWSEEMSTALSVNSVYDIEVLDENGEAYIVYMDRTFVGLETIDEQIVMTFRHPGIEPSLDDRVAAIEGQLAAYESAYMEGVQNA